MNAGTKREKGLNPLQLDVPARAVLLLLRLVVQVVDGRLRCVQRMGVSRIPLTKGRELAVECDSADVTPTAFECDRELAAPAWLVLVLSALAFAFMPVDVVLETASTFPTPVLAVLLTWLVAFCAAVLRLALLEVAEPSAVGGQVVQAQPASGQ
jgi:hypothetical protein